MIIRSCDICANIGRYLWCKNKTVACTAWSSIVETVTTCTNATEEA